MSFLVDLVQTVYNFIDPDLASKNLSESLGDLRKRIEKNVSELNENDIKKHYEFIETELKNILDKYTNADIDHIDNFVQNNKTLLNTATKNKVPLSIILIILNLACKSRIFDNFISLRNEKGENILHLAASYKGDDENFKNVIDFLEKSKKLKDFIKKKTTKVKIP